MSDRLQERPLRLPKQHTAETFLQVVQSMIGSIRAVHQHRGTSLPRGVQYVICDFPHSGQAHLRKKVEIIFKDHNDSRAMLLESGLESGFRIAQHGVEERD